MGSSMRFPTTRNKIDPSDVTVGVKDYYLSKADHHQIVLYIFNVVDLWLVDAGKDAASLSYHDLI